MIWSGSFPIADVTWRRPCRLPHVRYVPFADIGPATLSGYLFNSGHDFLLVRASSMTLVFERARGKNCIENAVNVFAVVRQRQRDGRDLNAIPFPFLVI